MASTNKSLCKVSQKSVNWFKSHQGQQAHKMDGYMDRPNPYYKIRKAKRETKQQSDVNPYTKLVYCCTEQTYLLQQKDCVFKVGEIWRIQSES